MTEPCLPASPAPPHTHLRRRGALGTAKLYRLGDLQAAARAKHVTVEGMHAAQADKVGACRAGGPVCCAVLACCARRAAAGHSTCCAQDSC